MWLNPVEFQIIKSPIETTLPELKQIPYVIVLHYTAASYNSALSWFKTNWKQASAHFLIKRDGEIHQLLSLKTRASHAGRSKLSGKENVNNFSIGIEFENFGSLTLKDGVFSTWSGQSVPLSEIELDDKGYPWHKYTIEQLQVSSLLVRELVSVLPIRFIVGHSEISLDQKVDPGKLFPLLAYKKLIV
jgi:N-acetylmuramoyl-L-alanine amidase